MSSNPHQGQEAVEEARALLAVFTLKPPADFTARTLRRARAHAAQHCTQSASPPVARWTSWTGGKPCRRAWYQRYPPRAAVAVSLLLALTLLGWGVFTPQPPVRLAGETPPALPLAPSVTTPPPVHPTPPSLALIHDTPPAPPLEPPRSPRNKGKRAGRGLRPNKV